MINIIPLDDAHFDNLEKYCSNKVSSSKDFVDFHFGEKKMKLQDDKRQETSHLLVIIIFFVSLHIAFC